MPDSLSSIEPVGRFPTTNREFLEGLFGDQWPRVHVCAIPGNPADPRYKGYWRGGVALDALGACTLATNNYYCVGLFDGPRQLVNFRALVVLGIDDVGPKLDPARVRSLLGPPSYRLETSPANEQWGYVIDPPLEHGDGAAEFQHRVRVLLTGHDVRDPGMEGLNRYLRLPFGTNGKPGYPPGTRTRLWGWDA